MLKKVICCSVLSFVLGNALCMNLDPMKGCTQKVLFSDVKDLQKESSGVEQAAYQELFKDLAPTLAIMKMFLKDNFKPLTGDEASIKNNLKDNVKAFYSSSEFTPYSDGRQEIILDRELTDILCNLIEREQKEALNGKVTFYHGMKGSNLFVYKYFARLFSHLTGEDLGDVVLRGDHLYAENSKTRKLFETLKELKDSYEFKNDYDRGLDVSTLQCNIALSVGPKASLSTASSVGFFCNSSSVTNCGVSQLIAPALMLQGMSIADARESAARAENFFNKYFLDLGGALLAISLPVENADKLANHIWMGGEEYDPVVTSEVYSSYKQFLGSYDRKYVGYDLIKMMKLIKSINKNMSNDEIFEKFKDSFLSWDVDKAKLAEQLKHFSSLRSSDRSSVCYLLENLKNSLDKDLSKEDVYFLTNEIYLYLHPKIKAKIFGTFRHPLSEEKAESLDQKIDELAAFHAGLIINSKNKPVEGSFVIPRKVAPNESMSYQIDLLPIFIERGRLTEAKQIIDQHPDFLGNVEIARLVLSSTLKTLYDNYDEVLEFIETNCGINKLLSKIPEDELYPFLHMFSHKNTSVAIGKLLKSSEIENDRVVADLISGFLGSGYSKPDLSLTSIFNGKQLSQQVMEKVLSRIKFGEGDVDVEFFTKNKFSFDPNEKEGREHLEELLKIREENPRHFYFVKKVLDSCSVNKENYPQLSEVLNDSGYEYDYEEEVKLSSYLESEEVDKEDKKSRIRQLSQWDQFSKIKGWLDYGDKNQQSLGEELSKEVKYPGTSMTIFDALEIYKKYVL
ncbi:MAG: hypothetical protein K5780_04005 [Alphaproteobacteria bacterium]|nr:hypothetical protein [Alphaproteobacteria bacterium]